MTGLKAHSQVVVVGGGIIGCSVACHIAEQGRKEVALLVKSELTAMFEAETLHHWCGKLEDVNCCFEAVWKHGELVAYPQSQARGKLAVERWMAHIPQILCPLWQNGEPPDNRVGPRLSSVEDVPALWQTECARE